MQFDPTLYVITDSTYHTTETLLRAVDEACRGCLLYTSRCV